MGAAESKGDSSIRLDDSQDGNYGPIGSDKGFKERKLQGLESTPTRKGRKKPDGSIVTTGGGENIISPLSTATGVGGHSHGGIDRAPSSSVVDDNNVTVNLAMADLMAYLQVVANNSSNLPLTRRDDPELGKTVSNLTADEYFKKSSAFIPSEVRIISGSFTKYGKVWDLPTSEEFNPSDSTQEPGISFGGACTNALLKVLYDMEAAQDENDPSGGQGGVVDYSNVANLFDDDDENDEDLDDDKKSITDSINRSFDSLVLNDLTSSTSISWADLLRKMKTEMQSVGYFQAPVITASRKMDISQPFSLVPEGFDKNVNKKRSLFIGCNYSDNTEAQLKGAHDDIRSMKDYIVNVHGFPETKGLMTVLLDDNEHKHPTHTNITESFKALSENAQPGDAVFVHFSGHGCRILDAPIDSDGEAYDEAIVPSDYSVSGIIRDTLMFKTLLAPMRHGVTVTILIDCCDTGMVFDLPYIWSTKHDRSDVPAKVSLNDDFSFVRFLKVIKSLYELSTFTQIGRTVGSALHGKGSPMATNYEEQTLDDDSTFGGGSLVTMDENETYTADYDDMDEGGQKRGKKSSNTGFMNLFSVCASPEDKKSKFKNRFADDEDSMTMNGSQDAGDEGKRKNSSSENASGNSNVGNLFKQVINCTLTHNTEDFSDEGSYHRDDTYYTDDEYDSYTDEEVATKDSYSRKPRRSTRRNGRRRGY